MKSNLLHRDPQVAFTCRAYTQDKEDLSNIYRGEEKPSLTLVWCVWGPVMIQQRTFTFSAISSASPSLESDITSVTSVTSTTSATSVLVMRGEMKRPAMKPRPEQLN